MAETWGKQITIPGVYVVSDLSSKQYHAVKWASTANVVKALAATTDVVVGILQDAPDASGEAATVCVSGITLWVAGTSVLTAGTLVTPDSTGRAKSGGIRGYARAIDSASAAGDEIRVQFIGNV